MKPEHKKAIECYQCPGCVVGGDISCFEPAADHRGCDKHVPGTMIFPVVGKIFLGMPTGFNRSGPHENMPIRIFDGPAESDGGWGFGTSGYGVFNVPVWKHLDEHGNTLVRGISPRVNNPFLHILLGDHLEEIGSKEITADDIEGMD